MTDIAKLFVFSFFFLSCSTDIREVDYSLTPFGISTADEPFNLARFEEILDSDAPNTFYRMHVHPKVRFNELHSVLELLKKKGKDYSFNMIFLKPTYKVKNLYDVPIDELPQLPIPEPPDIE